LKERTVLSMLLVNSIKGYFDVAGYI